MKNIAFLMWISFLDVLKIAESFVGERVLKFGVDKNGILFISLSLHWGNFDNFCTP